MSTAATKHWDERYACPGKASAAGFILPLTLWMIAIMGMVAASVNVWVARTVADSQALARRTQLELAQSNIRNELVYLLGTRPLSTRGLEVGPKVEFADLNDFNAVMAGATDTGKTLKLDGRPYTVQSDPDLVVSIQDGGGLFNLNTATPTNLRRILSTFEIPDPEINALIDTLLDYIDDDDYTRLAGAEAQRYERAGLPAPANEFLMTPFEVQRILGWNKLGKVLGADLQSPLFTTCQTAGFNPNTAPAQVLIANVQGLTLEKAEQAVAARFERPFRNIQEFGAAADTLLTDEPFFYSFLPGSCIIVDLVEKNSGHRTRFSLTFETTSLTRPWRVDYAIRIPAQYRFALDHLDPQAIFPTPESIDLPSGAGDGKAKPK
jgi:Type II secretion system (T2SS), protein K